VTQPERGHPEWTVGELAIALRALEKSMEAQFGAVLAAVSGIHTVDPDRYADRQGVIDERLLELRRDHDRDVESITDRLEKDIRAVHERINAQADQRVTDRRWLVGTVIAIAAIAATLVPLFLK